MTIANMLCALLLVVAVAGCQIDARRPQLSLVTVDGLLESTIGDDKGELPPTAVGTLFGAYHQTEVGQRLFWSDRSHAEGVARNSLETSPAGQTARWSNPDSGHTGTFTPINTYRSDDDLRCRDYVLGVTIDGVTQHTDGAACLAHDGLWRIVEPPIVRHRDR